MNDKISSLITRNQDAKPILREGIPLEKGVAITEPFLIKNESLFRKYADYFIAYPDLYIDLIKPENCTITFFFYERIILRALMRYKEVYITAPRAAAKSFLVIFGIFLQCAFLPGTKRFICAPAKTQAAKIAKEKLLEIFDNFPLLRREVIGGDVSDCPGSYGKDYITIKFRNKSQFDIVGALDTTRGGRRHGSIFYFFHEKNLRYY